MFDIASYTVAVLENSYEVQDQEFNKNRTECVCFWPLVTDGLL